MADDVGEGSAAMRGSVACPYVTGTVTRYCTLTPFTLTDSERVAIQWIVGDALSADGVSIQETLRGLLERTK